MHEKDDNKISCMWICFECQQCFLFEEDKKEHTRLTGHKTLEEYKITDIPGAFEQDATNAGANATPWRQQQDGHLTWEK